MKNRYDEDLLRECGQIGAAQSQDITDAPMEIWKTHHQLREENLEDLRLRFIKA